MSDLATLRLRDIRPAVEHFGNLRHHRCEVLEGLRRTAWRNMRHLSTAIMRVGDRPAGVGQYSREAEEWHSSVQAQMLSDQELENTAENRALLSEATFLPVRLYGAVLYAEIEFFCDPETSRLLDLGDQASLALSDHQTLIERLKVFRDRLLHPSHDSELADHELLQGGLFNQVPALQHDIDRLIECARAKLRLQVELMLDRLPPQQAVVCRYLHLVECLEHPIFRQHDEILAQIEIEAEELATQLQEQPHSGRPVRLSEQQSDKARTLASWMTCTTPLNTNRDVPEFDSLQPPMDPRLARAAFRHRPTALEPLAGRQATHFTENWRGHMQLLRTVSILLNETRQISASFSQSPGDLAPSTRTLAESMRETAPTELVRLVALGRVSIALMAPLIQGYLAVKRDNPTIEIAALEPLADHTNPHGQLNRFRNSIFHVQHPTQSAEQLDTDLLDAARDDDQLKMLFEGCAELLSLFAPTTPLPQQTATTATTGASP